MSIWDVKVKLPLHALPIFSLAAALGPGMDGGGSFPDLCGCMPFCWDYDYAFCCAGAKMGVGCLQDSGDPACPFSTCRAWSQP